MGWFTGNSAETDDPTDLALASVVIPLPLPQALELVAADIRTLPRWHVENVDAAAATIQATRRTRLFRFTDDITVRLEATADGTRVRARSQSRLGKADFGQNRRNLLELLALIGP